MGEWVYKVHGSSRGQLSLAGHKRPDRTLVSATLSMIGIEPHNVQDHVRCKTAKSGRRTQQNLEIAPLSNNDDLPKCKFSE